MAINQLCCHDGIGDKIHILTQKENMNKKKKTQEFTSSIIKGKDIKS